MNAATFAHGRAIPAPLDVLAGIQGLSVFAQMLRGLERDEIEIAIEAMIDHLNMRDGDPDLEPDDEDGEHDGSEPDESRPNGIVLPLPQYALDQSTGPINEAEVDRLYRQRMGAL